MTNCTCQPDSFGRHSEYCNIVKHLTKKIYLPCCIYCGAFNYTPVLDLDTTFCPCQPGKQEHVFQVPIFYENQQRIKKDPDGEPIKTYQSGVQSSKKPKFSFIPYEALVALAARYELGQEKYGEKAWNGLSHNQICLTDKEWLIARAEHIIHHAYTYIMKLENLIEDDGDDDAGAILWGGSLLAEAKRVYYTTHKRPKQTEKESK